MKKSKNLVTFFLLIPCLLNAQIYVDQDATGADDGTSWVNAFNRLEDALVIAQLDAEIWIADGTYHPSPTGDPTVCYTIPHGLKLYGGFAGTETDLSQRDIENNETILSGDYNGDDNIIVNTPSFNLTFENRTDNANKILGIENLEGNLLIDGFTISGSDDLRSVAKAALLVTCAGDCKFQLKNSVIKENRTGNHNAGVKVISGNQNVTETIIENNKFIHNKIFNSFGTALGFWAQDFGVSLHNVTIKNTLFYQNFGNFARAGAVYTRGNINSVFENCIFNQNFANAGGAIFNNSGLPCKIYNSDFYKNDGGSCSVIWNYNDFGNADVELYNCIFSENGEATNGAELRRENNNDFILGNCFLEENYSAFAPANSTNLGGHLVGDPLYIDAANGDFTLNFDSPAIDAGDNSYVNCPTDFAGNIRIGNGTVDIGALEYCSLPNGCIGGCIDDTSCNYDDTATIDDGSCQLPDGCTDTNATNYNPNAQCDDGLCEYAPDCEEYIEVKDLERDGALYGVSSFPLDGDEVYTWCNAAGTVVAQFVGYPYYSPSELGTYILKVTDPDFPDCVEIFNPRTITELNGCCELESDND